jgi:GAF domain-containing protein
VDAPSHAVFSGRYRRALGDHIVTGGEGGLREAYEMGRQAVSTGLSLLELVSVHHEALACELASSASASEATLAAGQFMAESLSAFEMVQRGFQEAVDRSHAARRHAAVIRSLSHLCSDPALASEDRGSIQEVLQLVAEHAREITGAEHCSIIALVDGLPLLVADPPGMRTFGAHSSAKRTETARISIPLAALSGRRIGTVDVQARDRAGFSSDDTAVLVLLAEMISAAIERQTLYASKP